MTLSHAIRLSYFFLKYINFFLILQGNWSVLYKYRNFSHKFEFFSSIFWIFFWHSRIFPRLGIFSDILFTSKYLSDTLEFFSSVQEFYQIILFTIEFFFQILFVFWHSKIFRSVQGFIFLQCVEYNGINSSYFTNFLNFSWHSGYFPCSSRFFLLLQQDWIVLYHFRNFSDQF